MAESYCPDSGSSFVVWPRAQPLNANGAALCHGLMEQGDQTVTAAGRVPAAGIASALEASDG